MLWIDWRYLDWHVISAWIFGILLGLYVLIRLKNHFFRWSASPPNYLQPLNIRQERVSQGELKQTKISVEESGDRLDSGVIWIKGKCPRFLFNIAQGLSLHVKKIYVNEVKSITDSLRQLKSDESDAFQIFYRKADQIGNELDKLSQNKLTILVAPRVQKVMISQRAIKRYMILGQRINQVKLQELEKAGYIIVNLHGGHHFRGWELALLGELIAILKQGRGGAK